MSKEREREGKRLLGFVGVVVVIATVGITQRLVGVV